MPWKTPTGAIECVLDVAVAAHPMAVGQANLARGEAQGCRLDICPG